jgi:uncharacterized cupredoxin-like copper-binding protein
MGELSLEVQWGCQAKFVVWSRYLALKGIWVKSRNCMKRQYTFNVPQLVGKVLVLVLALLVVACAGTSVATRSASTPVQQTVPTAPPEVTAVPGSVQVDVKLVEFRIFSSVTVFHPGVHYFFVVANRGHDVHEFMIMPDKPDGTPLPPDQQYKSMLLEVEPIYPGTTQTVNFTFSPSAAGRYEMACQMRDHYKAGMRLPFVVAG